MGWWTTNKEGHSFATNEGEEMVWGDGPADAIDGALDAIDALYQESWGRAPSADELIAGLRFSLGPRLAEQDPEEAAT